MLHNKVLDVLLLRSLQLGFCVGGCMKLRAHPLMSYRGVSNWPPVWVGTNQKHEPLRGEVGILETLYRRRRRMQAGFFCVSRTRDGGTLVVCCLRICLFADNLQTIYKLMVANRGCTIAQIGDIDLSHTL